MSTSITFEKPVRTMDMGSSPRRRSWPIVALLYVACFVVMGPSLQLSQWYVAPENNQGAAEAQTWLDGRWDLPGRGGDVARFEGRNYNVFPPLWTFVCYVVYGLHRALWGEPVIFFPAIYSAIVAAPVPLALYFAFRRSGADGAWAALLAFGAMAGTCLWPEATRCRVGWIYAIQHVMSQVGLALVIGDLLGRRRFWVAGLGVLIASWSRQTCLAYAFPTLWLAWRSSPRGAAMLRAAIPIGAAIAIPMVLNTIKFGSPLESGYRYIFAENDSYEAQFVRSATGQPQVFALRYVPDHLYHMWAAPPTFDLTTTGLSISGPGGGSAVWMGTPLLLLIAWEGRWWRDCARRALFLSTLPVIAALLAYHGPGYGTPGYYRYTLDFTLVWMALVAPYTTGPRRTWFTLACLAWSVFYYYMLTPWRGF